jgi:hypothetical protein
MGLASHGLALVLGYVLGRPDGRQHIVELRHQVAQLAMKPEVKQLGKRGRDLAGERALAARGAVSSKLRRNGSASGADSPDPDTGVADSGRRGIRARARTKATDPAGSDIPSTPAQAAGSDPAGKPASGFGGTTPLEDTQAVILGIPAPPPAGRTQPSRPAEGD